MATKANFTAEEWGRVLASPIIVGMAITAADPSGVWGLLKEGMAGGWAMLKAKQDAEVGTTAGFEEEGDREGFHDILT